MAKQRIFTWACLICGLTVAGACGSSSEPSSGTNLKPGDPFKPYESGNVTAIGDTDPSGDAPEMGTGMTAVPGETPVLVGTPEGSGGDVSVNTGDASEVCVDEGLCEVPPTDSSNWCEREGGPVDLIYVDGEVVQTICYPPADDPDRPTETVDSTNPGDINVVQNANRTTITFDSATDGMPITGNISVDGNNVAIYGNGPDNTILDGDVTLDGNNTRLRGLTITGDLVLRKNRVAVVLCRIYGNVRLETMSTNGSVFAQNEIFGDFTSDSNGNIIVGNAVLGAFEHSGHDNTCDGNWAFTDENGDHKIDDAEHGEPLNCGGK